MDAAFSAQPLTKETWDDLVALFELPGGSIVRGCWCMFYRKSGKSSGILTGTNKGELRRLVDSGSVPGLIGYLDGSPVGWISLGPREDYAKLRRSPIMKPVDECSVWSIVCTYVAKRLRGQGLQHQLLDAAIGYAAEQGVGTLEGLSGRQARAQSRRLHVLRLAELVRSGRLYGGRTPLAHTRRNEARAQIQWVSHIRSFHCALVKSWSVRIG